MQKRFKHGYFILALTVFALLFCGWLGLLPYPADVFTLDDRAKFGDSFGPINALISALGFVGLIITLRQQQAQIHAQNQKDEIDNYESTLFKLLDYYMDSVEGIKSYRNNVEYQGRAALSNDLQAMQDVIRKRGLQSIPVKVKARLDAGTGTAEDHYLLDYLTMENVRIIQYTVKYQRRMLASLTALLSHMEESCPNGSINNYRTIVSAQITHIETQHLFATLLIYATDVKLRNLAIASGLFSRDSAPYNFKFHQYLFKKFWGVQIGGKELARKMILTTKSNAKIKALSDSEEHKMLLKKHRISGPYQTLNQNVLPANSDLQ